MTDSMPMPRFAETGGGSSPAGVGPLTTRCQAVLKSGNRCKREGQPTIDLRSGRCLYYCIAHRRLLRSVAAFQES